MIANRLDDCVFVCLFVIVFLPVQRDYRITRVQRYRKDELFFQCRNIYLMVEGKEKWMVYWCGMLNQMLDKYAKKTQKRKMVCS